MSSQSVFQEVQQKPFSFSSIPQHWIRESGLRVGLQFDEPGVVEISGLRNTIVSVHIGPSVQVSCRRAGKSHRGTAVHGDVEIIPAGTPGFWEIAQKDSSLVLSVSPDLLSTAAEQLGLDLRQIEITNRFQVRDPQLENIAWALKAEIECGYPSGRLYIDSLAVSVAARLVRCYSSLSMEPRKQNGRLSDRRLRQVLSYIEDNLSQEISLADVAAVGGLSISHFKGLFRESVGLPVHQYLIQRRVEYAKRLLSESKLSISQIALEAGFAHQSHLSRHMRRLLGVSPKTYRETLR